jgi:YggT family protein|tara:strand:- start:4721 stop:4993 length:273 start_codon:yes stop_codon:yes gene_type:complete
MDVLAITFSQAFAEVFKFYLILLTLRIYLGWFPNINFWTQPFFTLRRMTDPYLRIFRGILPPVFGLDLSGILAFTMLTFLIDFFSSVKGS